MKSIKGITLKKIVIMAASSLFVNYATILIILPYVGLPINTKIFITVISSIYCTINFILFDNENVKTLIIPYLIVLALYITALLIALILLSYTILLRFYFNLFIIFPTLILSYFFLSGYLGMKFRNNN